MSLSYLIAEYKLYLSVSRWFRNSPDTTGWPGNWQRVHEWDLEHAEYWRQRAMGVKYQIRQALGLPTGFSL